MCPCVSMCAGRWVGAISSTITWVGGYTCMFRGEGVSHSFVFLHAHKHRHTDTHRHTQTLYLVLVQLDDDTHRQTDRQAERDTVQTLCPPTHLVLVQLDDEALVRAGHEVAHVGHHLVAVRGREERVAAAGLALMIVDECYGGCICEYMCGGV